MSAKGQDVAGFLFELADRGSSDILAIRDDSIREFERVAPQVVLVRPT